MSNVQKMLPCKTCGRQTPHLVSAPNHVLHLLLSLVTFGLWLPIWILIAFFSGASPTCMTCGMTYQRHLFERV